MSCELSGSNFPIMRNLCAVDCSVEEKLDQFRQKIEFEQMGVLVKIDWLGVKRHKIV